MKKIFGNFVHFLWEIPVLLLVLVGHAINSAWVSCVVGVGCYFLWFFIKKITYKMGAERKKQMLIGCRIFNIAGFFAFLLSLDLGTPLVFDTMETFFISLHNPSVIVMSTTLMCGGALWQKAKYAK